MKVLLFQGRGMLSRLIRWQQRTRWSHAAIMIDSGLWNPPLPPINPVERIYAKEPVIIEAWQGAGVRQTKLDSRDGVEAFEVDGLTDAHREKVVQFLKYQIGKGYDYLGVLRFVSRNRGSRLHKWFCSELVYAALESAGINLFKRTEAWEVSPGLLARSPLLRKVPL